MRIAIAGPRRGSVQLTCSGRRARLHAAVHLVIPSGVDFFIHIYPAVGLVSGLLAGRLGRGALAGAFIADALPGTLLKTGFGLFALFVALVMALRIEPPAGRPLSGIGGGTMTVPLL